MSSKKWISVSGDCVCDHHFYKGSRLTADSEGPRGFRAREICGGALLLKGLVAEAGQAFDGLVAWFAGLSTAAKVRLLVVTMLLAWLACIAAPALVLSTLAADNVTNLQGAIAFVQTEAPEPLAVASPAETPEPESAAAERAMEVAPLAASSAADDVPTEAAPMEALEAPQAAAQQEAATPTPWVIVVTNTPPPPTDTPVPTDTPLPPTAAPRVAAAAPRVAAPAPTAVPDRVQPTRDLDPRLGALNVSIQPAGVQPGQSYWRLVAARWANEAEAGGGHSIFVNVLDERGNRLVGQPVEVRWASGSVALPTEDKPLTDWARMLLASPACPATRWWAWAWAASSSPPSRSIPASS